MWANAEHCGNFEPAELRNLKEKLAQLSCKCRSCDKSKSQYSTLVALAQNDKQVQVHRPKNGSFDQFTQVNAEIMNVDHSHFWNTLTKEVLCPSCFVTLNLLRGGVLRVLKDEESETKQETFSCDKSTGKCIRNIEKSTSITNKPVPKFSNLTLCDFMTECSSDTTSRYPLVHEQKRMHQVKFIDDDAEEEKKEVSLNGGCLCLENFIDSIRPPLVDFYIK